MNKTSLAKLKMLQLAAIASILFAAQVKLYIVIIVLAFSLPLDMFQSKWRPERPSDATLASLKWQFWLGIILIPVVWLLFQPNKAATFPWLILGLGCLVASYSLERKIAGKEK